MISMMQIAISSGISRADVWPLCNSPSRAIQFELGFDLPANKIEFESCFKIDSKLRLLEDSKKPKHKCVVATATKIHHHSLATNQ